MCARVWPLVMSMAVTTSLLLAGTVSAEKRQAVPPDTVFTGTVARDSTLSGLAEKVTSSLSNAFAQARVPTLGPKAAPDRGPSIKLEDLTRLASDSQGRFFDGDFDGAAAQAQKGLKRFEAKFAYAENEDAWRAYSELQILRVLALKRIDEDDQAKRALEELCAHRPDFIPDPSVVPPKVVSLHQETLARLTKKAAGAAPLKILSRPAGADVVVNGRKVGVSPLEITDLLPGKHYVLVKVGNERFEKYVKLGKRGAKIEAQLGDPRAGAARQLNDRLRLRTAVADLGTLAEKVAPKVLTALIERDGERITVLIGRFERGRLEAVMATTIADDLSDVDPLSSALAKVSRLAVIDSSVDGTPDAKLRERFLGKAGGVRPEDYLGDDDGKATDPEEEGGVLTYVLAGTGVAAGAAFAIALAAGGGGAAFYFLVYRASVNTEGTDIIIDASRL